MAKANSKEEMHQVELRNVQTKITALRDQILEDKTRNVQELLLSTVTKSTSKPNPEKSKLRLMQTLVGHYGKIYAMHWNEDSVHLASASQDGKLMIWDAVSNHKRHMINLRSSWVMTCAYAPSGQFVACGGLDNLCSIYKVNFENAETNNRPQNELSRHDGYLSCCRFINDNKILSSSGDAQCILWDITRATPLQFFTDHLADVMSISLTQDNKSVFVSGSCDQTAKVFDLRAGEKCVHDFVGHKSDINAVQWFPDNSCFASGSDDSTVRLFDIRSYGELNRYKHDEIVCGATSLDFSKTGKYLFVGYDDNPFSTVWDTLRAEKMQTFQENQTRVSCLGVPQSGMCLCTGSWDNTLSIWASG